MNTTNVITEVFRFLNSSTFIVIALFVARTVQAYVIPFLRSHRILNNTKNLENWSAQIVKDLELVSDMTGAEKKGIATGRLKEKLAKYNISFDDYQVSATIEQQLAKMRAMESAAGQALPVKTQYGTVSPEEVINEVPTVTEPVTTPETPAVDMPTDSVKK